MIKMEAFGSGFGVYKIILRGLLNNLKNRLQCVL